MPMLSPHRNPRSADTRVVSTPKASPAADSSAALSAIVRLPARALLGLVWVYQRTLSPALPILFPSCGCRFAPTCSHYAAEAIRRHGAIAGAGLALIRLLKCTPLHPGGLDPVPASLRVRPFCRRASDARPAPHPAPAL